MFVYATVHAVINLHSNHYSGDKLEYIYICFGTVIYII